VENTLVFKQQTERKSPNHQVTTPSVKPDCIETHLPIDPNSALPVNPVRSDHTSTRTSDTTLPSGELCEPPPASEKEPTIHAIQVGDGDEENGFMTATSVTKEPTLAVDFLVDSDRLEAHEDGDPTAVVLADKGKGVDPREYGGEFLMDSDYFEEHEDGDHTTVVLADKGKSVDPREYGGALYDLIIPAGTTSTGGSHSIKLVGVHRDKGKNVDPAERAWNLNGMAKCEPGPSWIDFYDHGAMSFQKQGIPLQSSKSTKMTDLNDDGLPYSPTLPRLSWHPKISPYRFMVFLTPLSIGTVKAGLSLKGSATTPITLEWISGIVIFLV
jgi:hypothetical protein